MSPKPLFKRAVKSRLAYRWVRRVAYVFGLGGFAIAMIGKSQSSAQKLSTLELTGYALFLLAFVLFLVSYGFYVAIRIIETQAVTSDQ